MCERHSFILTRAGKVHDGYGVTDSHTTIRELAGLKHSDDTVNAYEWQPPKGWPEADWFDGLTKDTEVFELKSSHLGAMERHVKKLYPTRKAWDAGDKPRSMGHIEKFGGTLDLDLDGLTSAEGLVLPQSSGGGLTLGGLTSAEGLVLPQSIGGGLTLDGLTSAERPEVRRGGSGWRSREGPNPAE